VLLVGDGDNFARLKSEATTLAQYLEITKYFTYMIYYSIYYALVNTARIYKHWGINNMEFQPILLGGDDFSIILTSQELLPFVYYMDEALKKIVGRVKKDSKINTDNIAELIKSKKPYQWFGISAGAYIYKDTAYPLFLAREHAEELERFSKSVSKTLFQKNYNGSGLVVTIVSDKFFNLLDTIKKDRGIAIIGSDVVDVWKDIIDLENSNVTSRKIFNYVKLEGAELRMLYDVARNNPEAFKVIGRIILGRTNYNIFGYLVLLGSLMDSLEQKDFNNRQYYKMGEELIKDREEQ